MAAYLLVGVLGGIGMSSFYLLSTTTVTRWFDEHRGLALALVLVGFNLGYITAGPLSAWLIAKVGWRAAYATLGTVCGVVTMLAALTVRLPSAREAPEPRTRDPRVPRPPRAFRSPRRWAMRGSGISTCRGSCSARSR